MTGGLTRKLGATLKRQARRLASSRPIIQSKEPRPALNASVAGRRWNGQLFQPTPHAYAEAWGFGFVPPPAGLESIAVPLGRRCFGQTMRIRIWRCRGMTAADGFRAPGARGDALIVDRSFEAVAWVEGEPIAQFCRVDVSDVVQWQQCLHMVELRFEEAPRSPLAVGRSTTEGPWTWECGWVHLKGRSPVPLERPWGLAWAAFGRDEGCLSPRAREGEAEVMGEAKVHGFTISLPSVTVVRTQAILTPPTKFQVPEPKSDEGSFALKKGVARTLLPYRHVELIGSSAEVRLLRSELRRQGAAGGELNLDFRGWASRYDLVSIHRDSGHVALTLGQERDLDPEEFPAELPSRHIPLYSLYTTRSGVEAIPLWSWHEMVHDSRRSDHLWWLEQSRRRLRQTFRKLRRGGGIRLAGYGDSITNLGGRDPSVIDAPNGPLRDTMGYFERYGSDWRAGVELFSARPGEERRHHRLGWNWHLKAALEAAYDVEVEYLNWGISGTTTESDHKLIDGVRYPNGSEPRRLERLLESRPDIVTVCFGMNDIGDPVDTYANMRRICDVIRGGGADVIVVGLSQQNAGFDSRDHSLWRLTHDHVAAAAHDSDVAYIPTWEFFGDGNEGATGLSRWSHSAASMTNHPGARELACVGQYMAKIFN